jgi:diadenosine tetraphosphate (Ap4A) HIT family hydrolase
MDEIAEVSRALKSTTDCDKLNVAAIGNVVAQLHIHVIARSRNDPAWPKPVWNAVAPRAYGDRALQMLLQSLRKKLVLSSDNPPPA